MTDEPHALVLAIGQALDNFYALDRSELSNDDVADILGDALDLLKLAEHEAHLRGLMLALVPAPKDAG